ncbi:MAG: shikimate kinase, partial [Clostridiales bacterium]|nr:shikimate kinase [Clostridiales bacterium]
TVIVSRNGENNYGNIERHYADTEVIINTTPVGMYPDTGKRLVDLSLFKNCEAVMDMIYNPLKTAFLYDAEKAGMLYTNGLPMLVMQGAVAAEHFSGRKFSGALVEKALDEADRTVRNIVLIGMPGCGKSSVGKLLAEKTGRSFIDTDALIEKNEGTSIPDIFAKSGEGYFREAEKRAVREAGNMTGVVISCGGGVVTRDENYLPLKQNGTVYLIKRDVSLLSTDGRPLSKSLDELKKMEEVRAPMYDAFADLSVLNNGEVTACADMIYNDFTGSAE